MTKRHFASVWDAIEKSPGDAAAMKARADLMMAIREVVDRWETHADSMPRSGCGISQPRLNDLLRGTGRQVQPGGADESRGEAGLSVRVEVVRPAA